MTALIYLCCSQSPACILANVSFCYSIAWRWYFPLPFWNCFPVNTVALMSPFRICLPLFTSAFSFVNCACVHVCSHTRHSVRAEVRSQLEGVASLPLPCEARDELVQAWCQHYLRVISSPHRVFCSRVSPWDRRSPFRLGLAGRQPQGSFSRPPQYRCYKYLPPCSHRSSWPLEDSAGRLSWFWGQPGLQRDSLKKNQKRKS